MNRFVRLVIAVALGIGFVYLPWPIWTILLVAALAGAYVMNRRAAQGQR
jgi:hypothetical protein